MAAKINAGDVKRAGMFYCDPGEIRLDATRNGRWKPHDEASVVALAESMIADGQLQPIVVRKISDNRLEVVAGFRRLLAARWIVAHRDPEFKVKVILATCNEVEAFRLNVRENNDRKATSPVDDAFNQRRLRDQHGMSNSDIATLYGRSPSYIARLAKIPTLPDAVLAKLHAGEIGVDAAIGLADLPGDEATEIANSGDNATVKAKTQEAKRERGTSIKRGVKELRALLAAVEHPACGVLREFLDGTLGVREAEESLAGALGGDLASDTPTPAAPTPATPPSVADASDDDAYIPFGGDA